jgi:ribosomal-protein-alanine N-acetyltransferase
MPTVRAGTPADLSALRRIQAAAIAEPWPELLDLAVGPGPRLRVVATDRPVGYAVAVVAEDVAVVPELAVDPGTQGRGLGSTLLASLLDELWDAGVGRVRLTARAGDDRARSFYESRGFDAVDRLQAHFADDDGVVYERTPGPD